MSVTTPSDHSELMFPIPFPIIQRQPYGIKTRALASVHFGSGIHDIVIETGLMPLGSTEHTYENWYAPEPIIERAQQGNLIYAVANDFIFGHFVFREEQPLAELVAEFYQTMLYVMQEQGRFFPLRIWHFVPKLHDGQSAAPYQTLCAARASVIGSLPSMHCASTVIGVGGDRGVLYFLGAKQPGRLIENPRQVNARDYPPEYADPPAMFSRAVAHEPFGAARLYISGTASIVGHRSCHAGDVMAQLDEIAANLESLIAAAGKEIPVFADKTLSDMSDVKIYLKQGADWEKVQPYVEQKFGLRHEQDFLMFYGEMCRPELLIEVEAIVDNLRDQKEENSLRPGLPAGGGANGRGGGEAHGGGDGSVGGLGANGKGRQ